MIFRLVIPGYFNQPFFVSGQETFTEKLNIPKSNILIDHSRSIVAYDNFGNNVVKVVKARTWHEHFKLLWKRSSLHKEVNGNLRLAELGLRVPKLIKVGYRFVPDFLNDTLGFYVMENLRQKGFMTVKSALKNGELFGTRRKQTIEKIVADFRILQNHYVLFNDFHLDNVMVNRAGELAWIDTGIQTYSKFSAKRFAQKNNRTIKRLVKYYGSDFFSQGEVKMLNGLHLSK